jgi:hypothetical protein
VNLLSFVYYRAAEDFAIEADFSRTGFSLCFFSGADATFKTTQAAHRFALGKKPVPLVAANIQKYAGLSSIGTGETPVPPERPGRRRNATHQKNPEGKEAAHSLPRESARHPQ